MHQTLLLVLYLIYVLTVLQESEEEVTDTEQAENWFSLTSAQRICGMSCIYDYLDVFLLLLLAAYSVPFMDTKVELARCYQISHIKFDNEFYTF